MSLKEVDTLELVDRYNSLIKKYAELALEIAPKLEKFGKYKQELELLSVEFVQRGVQIQDPEGLKRLVEQELEKRKNVIPQTDQTERSPESR